MASISPSCSPALPHCHLPFTAPALYFLLFCTPTHTPICSLDSSISVSLGTHNIKKEEKTQQVFRVMNAIPPKHTQPVSYTHLTLPTTPYV